MRVAPKKATGVQVTFLKAVAAFRSTTAHTDTEMSLAERWEAESLTIPHPLIVLSSLAVTTRVSYLWQCYLKFTKIAIFPKKNPSYDKSNIFTQ